ncbi:hypothetical protein BG842_00630 [Haladaptatus sp. W1]|nr:hypothetical protein BG842_00630 [Haladaptatus sp. W1]
MYESFRIFGLSVTVIGIHNSWVDVFHKVGMRSVDQENHYSRTAWHRIENCWLMRRAILSLFIGVWTGGII